MKNRPRMFRLVRFFAVFNAMALIAVAIILYQLYRQTAVDEMIRTTVQHNTTLAQAIANAISPIYEELAGSADTGRAGGLRGTGLVGEVDDAIRPLVRGLPVLKIVIYDRNGTVDYSSELDEIGAEGAHGHGLAAALGGASDSEIEFEEHIQSLAGPLNDRYVIETYLPFIGREGAVLGVFELYSDVTEKIGEINKTSAVLLVGLLLVFSLFYSGLLLVIRHANRILARQYRDLEESRTDAQAKNEMLLGEIAHRSKVERELKLAREGAEEASRIKSRFLANMSHELRTPLNAIIGFSEVIAEEVLGRVSPSRYREYAIDIKDSGFRLLKLVNDILDLSKIEAGNAKLDVESFKIADAVRTAAKTVEAESLRNNNMLSVTCPENLGSMHSDPAKFIGILINLLGNAVKFTRNGKIDVYVTHKTSAGAGWINIEISDTGIGMDASRIDEMFDEFTQHDSSISRKYGGSGLGLAITRNYCEMLGGEIAIRSKIGEGTTVTVHLPYNVEGDRISVAAAE